MALPSVYVNATMRYGGDDKPLQLNVLWYTLDGGPGGSDDQDDAQIIADALSAQFDTPLSAVLTAETNLIGIEVNYHKAGTVWNAVSPFGSLAGDVASDTLPSYAAVVIQKKTAHAGRSGRGRWYVGCVPEDFTDSSKTTIVADAIYANLAVAFNGQPTAGTATLIPQHYSKKDNALYPITNVRNTPFLGTLRHRKSRPLL